MKIMKKILLLSLIVILNSCIASMQTVSLNHREYDGIKDGSITKDLGEPLITKGIEKYSKGIKMESSVNEIVKKQLGIVYDVNLRNGEVLYLGGTDKARDFYFSDNVKTIGNFTYKQGIALNKKTNQKYLFFSQGTYLFDKEFDFKYSETEYKGKECNECFKQELVYNGKSGNTIKVIYREYNNNMARPAFTQNLNYDLEEGDIISFKGCKIKVLNAKNTGIEFKILSTFN
jgi:hypothetical protein